MNLSPKRLTTEVLTPLMLRVLAVVCRHAQESLPPPSNQEIQEATGLSQGAVQNHLRHLRLCGLVTFADRRRRTVRPTFQFLRPDEL